MLPSTFPQVPWLTQSCSTAETPFLGMSCYCAHRELSVALVQSQGYVYRSSVLLLAKASGRPVLPGADAPYLD
jgi:hypothetical protein